MTRYDHENERYRTTGALDVKIKETDDPPQILRLQSVEDKIHGGDDGYWLMWYDSSDPPRAVLQQNAVFSKADLAYIHDVLKNHT